MKYAIVDLEATGTGSTAKIIQVGIVILENGEIKQTYQTDINPHEALEEHIKQLTGLSDQRLSQAPDFSQVAREIYELIEDAVFVAHNVKFDANLLAEVGADSASFYSLMIHDGSDISKEREKDKSVYIYDLERDEELHNLFY